MNSYAVKRIQIPPTTPQTYISGFHALNIPAPEETSGDWHYRNFFYQPSDTPIQVPTIFGEGQECNTNIIFGDFGVHECSQSLNSDGFNLDKCYSANHIRAILDILFERITVYNKLTAFLHITDEYLDTEEQKALTLSKAQLLKPYLTKSQSVLLQEWIKQEREDSYKA